MRALSVAVVLLLVAGCAQKPVVPRADESSHAATNDPQQACLDGVLVDDELVPIAGALVELLPGGARATSAADGRFAICPLDAGRYAMTVRAPGYHPYGTTIDFPTEDGLRLILSPQPVAKPRIVVVPKSLHYTLGWTTLDSTLGRNGLDLTNCSPCSWTLPLDGLPDHLLWEATWRRNPSPPPGVQDLMFQVLRAGAPFAAGEDIDVNEGASPTRFAYARAQMLEAESMRTGKTQSLSGAMYCSGNPTWPCLDQRIEIQLSLFYDYAGVPTGYSALRKT